MSIAQIILDQINALDPKAIFAWGTSKAISIEEVEDEHLGGLKLTIQNNPNIKEVATLEIILNGSDLYDIKIFSPLKEYYHDVDFYCGDLVDIIDQVAG